MPVHSSVYKNLRTNTPKETMTCPDYPNFGGEQQSCVKHETVVDYQKNYAKHFNLRRFIRFDTYVENVTPILNDGDCRTIKWHVKIRDLKTNAKYYVSFLRGRFELPSREKMIEDAEAMIPDKLEKIDEDWHWGYVDELAVEGKFDKLPDFYRRGDILWRDSQAANWLHFEERNLKVLDNGSVTVVKSESVTDK